MVKRVHHQEPSDLPHQEPIDMPSAFAPHANVPHPPSSYKFACFGLSQVAIAIVASMAWMAVSSGLIMLNKDLLSNGFPYPMALSGLGMCFSGCAAYIVCRVLHLIESKRSMTVHFYLTKIMPVGLFMAATLHFGNLAYLYLSVSFIQMLKAFTPIITMVALFVTKLETPSSKLILSVIFIALGTALAARGELNFDVLGVTVMLTSETCESVRLVMTQLLLTGLKFHPVEGLMYLAPACFIWLFIGSMIYERQAMLETDALGVILNNQFKFLAAAVMGFAVNSLAYIVIQTASSLTLKVLGTVKNALVVYLGVVILGDTVTGLQGFGYCISVVAFFWYQHIKMGEIGATLPELMSRASSSLAPRSTSQLELIISSMEAKAAKEEDSV